MPFNEAKSCDLNSRFSNGIFICENHYKVFQLVLIFIQVYKKYSQLMHVVHPKDRFLVIYIYIQFKCEVNNDTI